MQILQAYESQGQQISISTTGQKFVVVLSKDGDEITSRDYKTKGAAQRLADEWMAFSKRVWTIVK